MARTRTKKDNTAMFLLLAGGAVAAYALWQASQRRVLATGTGTGTYQYPSITNVASSFLASLKSLFGGNSTTGIRTEAIWYDYESAIGKYPPARYPAYWQKNSVTGSLEFVGPRDIDIMLPAA